MNLFRWFKRKPQVTLAEFYEMRAKAEAKIRWEDAMFDEWADGPGKDYPKHTVMMAEIEGAPLEPTEVWQDGWVNAFKAYCDERRHLCP